MRLREFRGLAHILSFQLGVCVSTQTRNLPVLEMGGPFTVMVPVPEVGNPISGTALTVCVFRFLARAHVQSRTEREREHEWSKCNVGRRSPVAAEKLAVRTLVAHGAPVL
jgi:hypothetical protein